MRLPSVLILYSRTSFSPIPLIMSFCVYACYLLFSKTYFYFNIYFFLFKRNRQKHPSGGRRHPRLEGKKRMLLLIAGCLNYFSEGNGHRQASRVKRLQNKEQEGSLSLFLSPLFLLSSSCFTLAMTRSNSGIK